MHKTLASLILSIIILISFNSIGFAEEINGMVREVICNENYDECYIELNTDNGRIVVLIPEEIMNEDIFYIFEDYYFMEVILETENIDNKLYLKNIRTKDSIIINGYLSSVLCNDNNECYGLSFKKINNGQVTFHKALFYSSISKESAEDFKYYADKEVKIEISKINLEDYIEDITLESLKVTAQQIYNEFMSNGLVSDTKYNNGSGIVIQGTVDTVQRTMGRIQLKFIGNEPLQLIFAFLNEDQLDAALKLNRGSLINVRCESIDSLANLSVSGQGCTIQ